MNDIPEVGTIVYDRHSKKTLRVVMVNQRDQNDFNFIVLSPMDDNREWKRITVGYEYSRAHLEPDAFLTEVYKTHGR